MREKELNNWHFYLNTWLNQDSPLPDIKNTHLIFLWLTRPPFPRERGHCLFHLCLSLVQWLARHYHRGALCWTLAERDLKNHSTLPQEEHLLRKSISSLHLFQIRGPPRLFHSTISRDTKGQIFLAVQRFPAWWSSWKIFRKTRAFLSHLCKHTRNSSYVADTVLDVFMTIISFNSCYHFQVGYHWPSFADEKWSVDSTHDFPTAHKCQSTDSAPQPLWISIECPVRCVPAAWPWTWDSTVFLFSSLCCPFSKHCSPNGMES